MRPKRPPASASVRSWSSVRLRGWSLTARHAACEQMTGAPPARVDDLRERRGRGVGEIEDDAELDELVDEGAAQA